MLPAAGAVLAGVADAGAHSGREGRIDAQVQAHGVAREGLAVRLEGPRGRVIPKRLGAAQVRRACQGIPAEGGSQHGEAVRDGPGAVCPQRRMSKEPLVHGALDTQGGRAAGFDIAAAVQAHPGQAREWREGPAPGGRLVDAPFRPGLQAARVLGGAQGAVAVDGPAAAGATVPGMRGAQAEPVAVPKAMGGAEAEVQAGVAHRQAARGAGMTKAAVVHVLDASEHAEVPAAGHGAVQAGEHARDVAGVAADGAVGAGARVAFGGDHPLAYPGAAAARMVQRGLAHMAAVLQHGAAPGCGARMRKGRQQVGGAFAVLADDALGQRRDAALDRAGRGVRGAVFGAGFQPRGVAPQGQHDAVGAVLEDGVEVGEVAGGRGEPARRQAAVGLDDGPAAFLVPGAGPGLDVQGAVHGGGAERPEAVGFAVGADADAGRGARHQAQFVRGHEGAGPLRRAGGEDAVRLDAAGEAGAREDGARLDEHAPAKDAVDPQSALAHSHVARVGSAPAGEAQGAGALLDEGRMAEQVADMRGLAALDRPLDGQGLGRRGDGRPPVGRQLGGQVHGPEGEGLADRYALGEFQARADVDVQGVGWRAQGVVVQQGQAALQQGGVAAVGVAAGQDHVAGAELVETAGGRGSAVHDPVDAHGVAGADAEGGGKIDDQRASDDAVPVDGDGLAVQQKRRRGRIPGRLGGDCGRQGPRRGRRAQDVVGAVLHELGGREARQAEAQADDDHVTDFHVYLLDGRECHWM